MLLLLSLYLLLLCLHFVTQKLHMVVLGGGGVAGLNKVSCRKNVKFILCHVSVFSFSSLHEMQEEDDNYGLKFMTL